MIDDAFKAKVDAYVDEVWEDAVEDIRSLVKIDSVEDLAAAEPGKPWGPAAFEALEEGLRIAARIGLDAHNCEGYIGYADLPGESEKQIATIAPLAIAPLVKCPWRMPFSPQMSGNSASGVKRIVGNNEETMMADVDWYLKHFEAPAFCFTPDAEFPLICGEKGILHGHFTSGAIANGAIVA